MPNVIHWDELTSRKNEKLPAYQVQSVTIYVEETEEEG